MCDKTVDLSIFMSYTIQTSIRDHHMGESSVKR